jgi:hypothetical protein
MHAPQPRSHAATQPRSRARAPYACCLAGLDAVLHAPGVDEAQRRHERDHLPARVCAHTHTRAHTRAHTRVKQWSCAAA